MNRRSMAAACLMAFGTIGSAFAAVNCNSFPDNTVTGSLNDDVIAAGYTCTIAASAFVNGSLTQTGNGNLVIRGVVNGSVSESGAGSISMVGGSVGGDLSEADGGNVTLRGRASVNGGMLESGTGSVTVNANSGSCEGSVIEADDGGVIDRGFPGRDLQFAVTGKMPLPGRVCEEA